MDLLILLAINGTLALAVIVFTLASPGQLNPTQLRLLKFKDNQKKLAESIQSIVILPFDNFTGNDDNEFFVAGMQSSLITDMGRIGALKVMCNTTSNSFKGTNKSVQQIASELDVDAAVEASITCLGDDSICIQARLIYAAGEEQQLWVQDFRIAKSQVLNFYNDVSKIISEEINIVLSPQEESMLAETRTVDPEAYDAYLMGKFFWEKLDRESAQKALEYFQLAIDLDPQWADPYAGLANAWSLFGLFRFMPKSVTLPNTYKFLNKALELDPLKPLILTLAGGNNDNDQSKIQRLEKALSIDPNFGLAIVQLNDIHMKTAFANGDFEKWIELWDEKVQGLGHWNDEGRAAVLKAFHEHGHIAAIEEMFKMNEKYGNDCWMSGGLKAERYIILGEYDKAMDCLEKEYEIRDMSMTYITTNEILYNQLKDNPRYIKLLKEMNLSID